MSEQNTQINAVGVLLLMAIFLNGAYILKM